MNPNQRDMMLHALGGDAHRPWRNYYCECAGTSDHAEWVDLFERGLAKAGRTINDGRDAYFHVTERGIEMLKQTVLPATAAPPVPSDPPA